MDPRRHYKLVASTAIILVAGPSLCLAPDASGASGRQSRTIQIFVTPNLTARGGGTILITGAIGDYGKAVKANASGQPDAHGTYSLSRLRHGSMLLNTTTLKRRIQSGTEHAYLNPASCSIHGSTTADVPIVRGTGAYSGITGDLSVTFRFAEFAAKYTSGPNKGQCDKADGPVAEWAAITGSGTVTLS